MANLSDAYGTIRVKKVGREFLDFLNEVQGSESKAYYTLVDRADLENLVVNADGYLEFTFCTSGRWSYDRNIEGYLNGEWLNGEDKESYQKFIDILKEKGGRVEIEYTDSDTATDWMGTGGAVLEVVEGDVSLSQSFDDEPVTVKGFAELNNESEEWALEYIHGEEVSEAREKYVEECKLKGRKPASADVWLDTMYVYEEV